MAETIFWASVGLLLYTYIGYPALLLLISVFRDNPVRRGPLQPATTIIIAAHNEERRIRDKIENTLALVYPSEKKGIIIASDGSTDDTNRIASAYFDKGVKLVAVPTHRGKEAAQLEALKVSTGEVVIFSDVATLLNKDALGHIVSNFNDRSIGCVSSVDRVQTRGDKADGEKFYVTYEMMLRRLESQANSLVGLSGSCFAVRRDICEDWSTTLPSDFLSVIHAVKRGYRAVIDTRAVGFYKSVDTETHEFKRKVRTVVRGMAVLMDHLEILNPFRYGFFSVQIASHKLLRWLVPMFMVCAIASNSLLAPGHAFYGGSLVGQAVFYCLATLGLVKKKLNRLIIFKIPAFISLVAIAMLVAWYDYLRGRRTIRWEPSRRG